MTITAAAPANLEPTPMERAELEAREIVSRLYREITTELAQTADIGKDAPLDALDQLNRLRRRVTEQTLTRRRNDL